MILIVGAKGMLGQAVVNELKTQRFVALEKEDLDITDLSAVTRIVERVKPRTIINCAAYTDVDGCEDNQDIAYLVNAIGPRNLAVAAESAGAELIHISTDYVFSGDLDSSRREEDSVAPLSIYGRSKLLGEQYIRDHCTRFYILRTAWLFGPGGKNFVSTMANLAKSRKELTVVNDQKGSPTYTVDLARAICQVLESQRYGVYHVTNSEYCTWYDFAKEIMCLLGAEVKVLPLKTEELGRPAPRPAYSMLDNSLWRLNAFEPLRPYREALREYIATLKE